MKAFFKMSSLSVESEQGFLCRDYDLITDVIFTKIWLPLLENMTGKNGIKHPLQDPVQVQPRDVASLRICT